MTEHDVDGETSVALMQCFEEKNGNNFNIRARLSRFYDFLSKFENKSDMIGTINDLGLLSTDELESRCAETDNWMPLMVRQEVMKKAFKNGVKDEQSTRTRSRSRR